MKLREALATYVAHSIDLAPSTTRAMKSQLRTFTRYAKVSDVRHITNKTFVEFRRAAIADKLSPATVNSVCRAVSTILRHLGPPQAGTPHGIGYLQTVPYSGKKLRERTGPKWAPTLTQLSDAYEHCGVATWPKIRVRPATFWRAFLAIAYNTALRRSDLRALSWEHVDFDTGFLSITAQKTGKNHRIPVNDTLRKHLLWMWSEADLVLPCTLAQGRFDVELSRICASAGVPRVTPQAIRRRACTELETLRPGAGALLLGHSLTQTVTYASYAQQSEVLQPALAALPQPQAFNAEAADAQLFLF